MDSLVTVKFVDIAGAENDKTAMTIKMSSESLPLLNAKQKICGIDGPVFIIDRTFYREGEGGADYLILYRR
jgi:hypothetical protein